MYKTATELHRPERKMRQTHFPFRTSRRQKKIMGTQSVPIFFLFGVTLTFVPMNRTIFVTTNFM